MSLQFGVDRVELRPGFDAQDPGLDPFYLRERGDVEQDAAVERHGLAVISSTAGAHRERYPMPCAGCGRIDDVIFVAGCDDQIRRLAVELLVQDRAVPEEIPRSPPHHLGIENHGDIAEIGDELVQRMDGEIVHDASPWLRSE